MANGRGQIDATTGTQNGEYYGDSGGPLFFQMPDGSWRVIGVDSSSPDIIPGSNAARISTYTSVPTHVAWLETTSGVDLTPCHAADGWNPGPACAEFPTNPATGAGGWAALCNGQTRITPRATCGGQDVDAQDAGVVASEPDAGRPQDAGAAGPGASEDGPIGGVSGAGNPDRNGAGASAPPGGAGNAPPAGGFEPAAGSPASSTSQPPEAHARGGCSSSGPSGSSTGRAAAALALCLGLARRRARRRGRAALA